MGSTLGLPLGISSTIKRTMTKPLTNNNYDETMLDHVFSGWSVWLEPESTEPLAAEMSFLQNACGATDHGVFPFVPHVTLLYNMDPSTALSSLQDKGVVSLPSSSSSSSSSALVGGTETSRQYEQLLQQCWDQLLHRQMQQQQPQQQQQQQQGTEDRDTNGQQNISFTTTNDDESNTRTVDSLTLQPIGYYYLHYPKSADGGKGFGCSIAYLLFQSTPWLHELRSICRTVLGPDERAGLTPHMSLVYSPEAYGTFLRHHVATKQRQEQQQQQQQQQEESNSSIPRRLGAMLNQIVGTNNNNRTKNSSFTSREENCVWWLQPHRVAYLSLWSTEGRIQDWYPIAKIPIASSQLLSPPPSTQ
jgi:hypothetical protein